MGDNSQRQNLLRAAIRRLWIVVACVVVGAGGAYLLASSSQKQYTATSSLLFQQSGLSQQLFGYSVSSVQNPTTEQATDISLSSEPVISLLTAQSLGSGLGFKQVEGAVNVSAANEGEVINVSATTRSPDLSARVANSYAQNVIDYQKQQQLLQVQQAAAALRTQIAQLPKASSAEITTLTARLSQIRALESLQTGDVQIAGRALPPTLASSPQTKRETLLGLLLGLIVGIVGAAAIERRDTRVRTAKDAAVLLSDIPILGQVPLLGRGRRPEPGIAPGGGFGEAFRLLRAQLRYFSVDKPLKSVVVMSPSPGDGKSTVAWNLAVAAATASPDLSILLMDVDLRRPSIARLSGADPMPGLSEVLAGAAGFDEVLTNIDLGAEVYLSVLTAGGIPPNPGSLLESHTFTELLRMAEERFDLVVIDSSPILVVSDAIPVLQQVSGVLVVLRIGQTHRAAVRSLVAQLGNLKVQILGAAINAVAQSETGYGQYGRYGYADYYDAPSEAVKNEGPDETSVVTSTSAGANDSVPEPQE